QKVPARVQYRQGGNSVLDGHMVLPGQIQVLILAPQINLDNDKVFFDDRSELRFMHLRIQRMAVRSPVGAEDEHNIPFALLGVSNCRGNVVMRIRLLVINGRGGGLFSNATEK